MQHKKLNYDKDINATQMLQDCTYTCKSPRKIRIHDIIHDN